MKDSNLSIEETLVKGSNNRCTTNFAETNKPLVVRGVIKKDSVQACTASNRDFYYIDTGYLGNFPSIGNPGGKKLWHRVVKNENQHSVLRECPPDRWQALVKQDPSLEWNGWKNQKKKILLVMPNPKACRYYDHDYDTWVAETQAKIKEHTDLPIEVRIKGSRSERNLGYTIYDALDSGVHATVAFNSIAAVESVLHGIPAFVSVPCAASPLASSDLSKIMTPYYPDVELIKKQCYSLAYGQFTMEEIENGTAWHFSQKY
jgi:hypothetical protein